jgi:hypothetical protein
MVASLIIGITTIVPQITVPFAALLAPVTVRAKWLAPYEWTADWDSTGSNRERFHWCRTGLAGNVLDRQWRDVAVGGHPISSATEKPTCGDADLWATNAIDAEASSRAVLQEASITSAMAFGAFSVFWSN